ncbi:branched-chain amino acid ABC transporter substrate-binding protein, partial [Burkholderia multivorans]
MKIARFSVGFALSAFALVASVTAGAQSAPQTILIGLAAPLTG